MIRSQTECLIRLGLGLVANALLWPVSVAGARWGGYDREVRLMVLAAALAVMGLASLIPIFWRGKAWQVPIAFVLLWFPVAALYVIVSSTIRGL